jgi:nucleoside-diphosphate-sugar epimerase
MKIGILGGSSQVGASLALYFKLYNKAAVTVFIRTSYSRVFFEIHGIACETISLNNREALATQLADFDVIVDCSYPAGQLYEILSATKKNMEAVISAIPVTTVFIYMSSIMAYGMPDGTTQIADYKLPRTAYAFIKRKAESYVVSLCKKHGKKGYNFRLGQVHGFLQSVDSSFREKLSAAPNAFITGNPESLTNTIFINSIGEAVVKCGRGELLPGLYTLVSEPQWTLQQLYGYYVSKYSIDCAIHYQPEVSKKHTRTSVAAGIMTVLKRHRPVLETYILMHLPKLAIKIKGRYRQAEVSRLTYNNLDHDPIDFNLLGKPGRQVVNDIASSPKQVTIFEEEMEVAHNNAIRNNKK